MDQNGNEGSVAYDFGALRDGRGGARDAPATPGTIQKTNWWHEQIIDWELMNPGATMRDCALHFNKTESWLSTVRNSDAFREFRARRIAEHQALVSESVIDKVEGLAKLTLDTLHTRIEEDGDEVPLSFVRETAETALKALGYGNKGGGGTAPTVQIVNVVSAESLERARSLMRQKGRTIDAKAEHEQLPAPA